MNVNEIMSTNLITLHPKDKIDKAKNMFARYKIHHIPIVVMGKVVGIISQGDVLSISGKINTIIRTYKQLGEFKLNTIDEIMTNNPICINSETNLESAVGIMIKNRINALPIVDNNKLVGLITSFDILKKIITQK